MIGLDIHGPRPLYRDIADLFAGHGCLAVVPDYFWDVERGPDGTRIEHALSDDPFFAAAREIARDGTREEFELIGLLGGEVRAVMQAMSEGSPGGRMASDMWRQSGNLRIKRMNPVLTGRGKLLPLHLPSRQHDVS